MRLIYNQFKSPLEQTLMDVQILPMPAAGGLHRGPSSGQPVTTSTSRTRREIFAPLLPRYVEIEIYRALLESSASEQGARMTAMRNAARAPTS